jgi:hypothetical protein
MDRQTDTRGNLTQTGGPTDSQTDLDTCKATQTDRTESNNYHTISSHSGAVLWQQILPDRVEGGCSVAVFCVLSLSLCRRITLFCALSLPLWRLITLFCVLSLSLCRRIT